MDSDNGDAQETVAGDGDGDDNGDGDGDDNGDGDDGDGDGDDGDGDGDDGDGDGDDGNGDGDGDDDNGDGDDGNGDGDGDDPACFALEVAAIGDCDALLGFAWIGDGCEPLHGCTCEGPDCGQLKDTESGCWSAHLMCGPTPCAGLPEDECEAHPLCDTQPASELILAADGWCYGEPFYAGCYFNNGCPRALGYACKVGTLEPAYMIPTLCLPELGWEFCRPDVQEFFEACT